MRAGHVQGAEFGAGLLVLHEGATLHAEGVQLGGYFLGEQGRNLSTRISFFPMVFFWPVLAFFEHSCPSGFFDHTENFFWTHVEYLWVNEKVIEGE